MGRYIIFIRDLSVTAVANLVSYTQMEFLCITAYLRHAFLCKGQLKDFNKTVTTAILYASVYLWICMNKTMNMYVHAWICRINLCQVSYDIAKRSSGKLLLFVVVHSSTFGTLMKTICKTIEVLITTLFPNCYPPHPHPQAPSEKFTALQLSSNITFCVIKVGKLKQQDNSRQINELIGLMLAMTYVCKLFCKMLSNIAQLYFKTFIKIFTYYIQNQTFVILFYCILGRGKTFFNVNCKADLLNLNWSGHVHF